jgi:hypothetical protein
LGQQHIDSDDFNIQVLLICWVKRKCPLKFRM